MIAKQKISAIAKDINVAGKDIVKMLADVAGITKTQFLLLFPTVTNVLKTLSGSCPKYCATSVALMAFPSP